MVKKRCFCLEMDISCLATIWQHLENVAQTMWFQQSDPDT